MINLTPFMEKITKLEKENTDLKGSDERPAKRLKSEQKDLPSMDVLKQFEHRADEAEQRIKALSELTTRLEQQLKSQKDGKIPPQTSSKATGPPPKEKKKEIKGAPVSPFINALQNLNKGQPPHTLPLVHLSQKNEQFVCSFCQETHKVFFTCQNEGCSHRPCASCAQQCDKCGFTYCRFCGECWKCNSPHEASLAIKLANLKLFFTS